MNPFKNSLINKIKFLGFMVSILMILVLFFAYQATKFYDRKEHVHNAIQVSKLLKKNTKELQAYLDSHNIKKLNDKLAKEKLKTAINLIQDDLILSVMKSAGINLFISDNNIIFVLKEKNHTAYFLSIKNIISGKLIKLTLYATLLFFFLFNIYYYIKNALSPLLRLNKNIEKFSKSEDIDFNYETANDEIAKVANAFYSAMQYNKKLKLQRDMFVRTIMHEVKTSLTKAKFITHFMEDGKEEKEKLNALIASMQDELDKLHEFENVNTKILAIKKERYSLNALVADVCDVLLLEDKEIAIYEEEVFLNFDYTLLMVAIKNLVDNAIKYSKDNQAKIYIKKNYIEIKNLAINIRALDITRLMKPFKQEDDSNSGMGLGLYLINEIINKHDLKLEYKFIDGYHSFKIVF